MELIEEATRLLRSCSALPLVCFYTGTLPFVLAALYFWADMSRSADASSRCATNAFLLALLYFWMRGWQSLFLQGLRNELEGREPARISIKEFVRVMGRQMVWQAIALLSLPFALILTLPFGWVFAFHQHITVLAGEGPDSPPLLQAALKEAGRWPGQNHAVLLLLSIFALLVGLNVAIALFQLPSLLKIFFGIDLLIGRNISTALNTTFLAAVLGVTYLLIDPLVKACYLLRSFYEQSIKSGADLRAQLRKLNLSVVWITLLLFFIIPLTAPAAEKESADRREPDAPRDSQPVSASELDRALEETIAQSEYRWRLPREKKPEAEDLKKAEGFFESIWSHIKEAFTYLGQALKKLVKKIADSISQAVAWIQGKFSPKKTPSTGGAWDFSSAAFWKFLALALAVIGGGWLFWHLYRHRKDVSSRTEHAAELVPALPDLTDEQVTADQLSEESWLKLATSLVEQGDLRLAVRALYLASLSHLASREMIRITKFKTNRDYQREVQRRARTQAELQAAFSENLNIFEQSWYGVHEITADLIETFRANLQRIKTC